MGMHYKSIVVTRRGGPEVLRIIENDLRAPRPREARVRILASSVSADDVGHRRGNRPFLPRIPFVPGYAIIGIVDALGQGVTGVAPGDQVAALVVTGGYAEYIYLRQVHLVPVPTGLDPQQAVTLVLNYVTAYQMLHRVAKVEAGDTALMIGASGGVGTALLELGRLAGLTMYALASSGKHGVVTGYGAVAIDYHAQDYMQVIQHAEPEGLDVVFDGMGEGYVARGMEVLRHGGQWVAYGAPQGKGRLLAALGRYVLYKALRRDKSIKLYGTSLYRFDRRPFLEDWSTLFRLLGEGKLHPVISGKFPILEAAKANVLLESGQVTGNLVLVAPELTREHG